MIRVVIMDDHAIVRAGIRSLLLDEEDIEVVGEAADGASGIHLIEELDLVGCVPHVVLLDLRMEEPDSGFIVAQYLHRKFDELSVVMYSSFATDDDIARAISSGARGYVVKDAIEGSIVRAVKAVAAGYVMFSIRIFDSLMSSIGKLSDEKIQLTARELEIAAFLSQNLSNREIAEVLFVSDATVKTHVANLFGKLGVSTRQDAVRVALKSGYI